MQGPLMLMLSYFINMRIEPLLHLPASVVSSISCSSVINMYASLRVLKVCKIIESLSVYEIQLVKWFLTARNMSAVGIHH